MSLIVDRDRRVGIERCWRQATIPCVTPLPRLIEWCNAMWAAVGYVTAPWWGLN